MYGWRARIGLITPPDNLLIEPELTSIVPKGVSIHSTRLSSLDLEELPKEAEGEAEQYGKMGIDVIAYACNASSFYHGTSYDEKIASRLNQISNVPSTTASTSILKALRQIDASTLSVVTPYDSEMNDRLVNFLDENDFEIANIEGLGLDSTKVDDVVQINEQSPQNTYNRIKDCNNNDSDAILITATNLASLKIINTAEQDFGKPVISANQALLWHSLKLADVETSISNFGSLFLD